MYLLLCVGPFVQNVINTNFDLRAAGVTLVLEAPALH